MQQRGPRQRGGLGRGAGRAPSAWQAALASTQGMLHAGATQQACGPRPHDGGAGSSLRYPLRGGAQRESRAGGGAGAQGGKLGQPGHAGAAGWEPGECSALMRANASGGGGGWVHVPRQGGEALGWQGVVLIAP